MKTTRCFFLTLLMALMVLGAEAQISNNKLSVPDITVQIGQAQLPVYIDNTDEIVAAQFDLILPEGMTAEPVGTLSNRSDGHNVTVRNMGGQKFRVVLYSPNNSPIRGQSGVMMYIPVTIPEYYEEDSEHPIIISDAVLSKVTGENALTRLVVGAIHVAKLPDLTVKNISADKMDFTPGGNVVVSWQVENVGGIATVGGWSEQVLLVADDGVTTKLIATTYYDEILEPQGVVSRQAEITLPTLLGIDGHAFLQVKVVPTEKTGESTSAQANNSAESKVLFTVGKLLQFELSPSVVNETYTGRITAKFTRSGRWDVAEVFNISSTEDSRIYVPATVTIPAGQSGYVVYLKVNDNEVLDDNSVINISVEGNGYAAVEKQLTIEDNEYPDLTLTASKSELTEGETFQLTVTTSRSSSEPIVVTLTSENIKRFSLPQTVTIPAGEVSTTFDVVAVDDELPSLVLSNVFSASAPNHNKAEVIVVLQDNDLPVLELQLTPTTVQESAGPVAVAGVLRRTTNTNSKITVKLTDNANGGLYFGNRTLILDKGVEEVHFNFGPIDNVLVDGDRNYTITAAVWLSSCSCGASGESAGYVEAQLKVLDNDGPALNVTSSMSTVKEGNTTTLTISRNTSTNYPLTVNISSDYEDGLNYSHSVTIPAGQQSTTVEVTSAANSVQGDSHTAIFTVQADGYATGTCFLMVTDQTLPDARISSITTDVTEAEVNSKAKLTIEVTNDGAAELPAKVVVKVYRRGESSAVGTLYTSEAIPVGGSLTLTKIITLPSTVNNYSYYAVVNEENKVDELSFNNNTSRDVAINTIAPFSVSVSTNKSIYNQGEKILITGKLTGNGTANTEVELYVINEGARQVQSVTTDANGFFTYEWQLYALQSGHFVVGACYPGEGLKTEMATFDVYGLRRTNNDFITCETKLGEPYEGVITIENPGQLPQTITSFEVVSQPDACEVVLEAPTAIIANGTAQLKYKLTGSAVTETKDWETIVTKLTTNEGSTLTITLYYFCTAHHAVLTTNTTSFKTTMTKGATRDYLLSVMNTGKGATGKIIVQIPDVGWMKLNTPAEMPSLEYGETATVSLRLTPTDDMSLNLPYTGRIALNCENGNGVSVNYNIEVVSESTGILTVDVVDEYTYYTDEKPHVAGAGVVVKHPVTGAIVAQGFTGDDGIYSVELPEGYYTISVTEGHHNSMTGNILIDPGDTNHQEIFLSYTAVTYSWDVVETEIEDEYKIETIAKFETNVPKPVVVVNLPTERPADGSIIAILVTNKGLINAQNVVMNLDCTDGYELELLNPDPVEILAPQQMYTFYARFKKSPAAHSRRKIWGNPDVDCISIFAGALYDYMCGNAKNMEEALAQNGWGDCIGDGDGGSTPSWRIKPVPHTGPSWPSGPSSPGGGTCINCGPSSDGPGVLETLRQWYCSLPCGKELTQALACEAAGAIIPDWISCPYNLLNNCVSRGRSLSGCIKAGLTCTPPGGHTDCWLPYIYCMATRNSNNSRAFREGSRVNNTSEALANNYIASYTLLEKEKEAFWRIVEEHFGDKEWLDYDNMDLVKMLDVVDALGENHLYTSDDFKNVRPALVTDELLARFVERLNNTFQNTDYEDIINYIHPEVLTNNLDAINECEEEAMTSGWSGVAEMYTDSYNAVKDYVSESTNSVCASVSIKISQTMVMTRQAFRGTLTVFNGNEETAMQDVKLNLEVVSKYNGKVATAHEFQINAESLDGFTGELDLGSGWTLDANATGTATVLFIPTKYAAPDKPEEWSFGGTLSYIDPYTGLEVTRELYPVTLTVKPCPELDLTYFMQRDVYGDDALTLDVIEPTKPAEFALLINNKGYGDATNVRMVTQQPEIIENEKGLYIDFELISSQVNGGDAALSFGQSIANDFGTIPAHSQMYAQWWLTSTLLGHFTDYKVEASHITSYDNPDLSLIDQVSIHELIRSLDLSTSEKNMRGFLVNDIADANDLPDKLYLTNGDIADVVQAVTAKVEMTSSTTCLLTITPSAIGWNYGSILDPTNGFSTIKSIVRQSDGKEIVNVNFWQTDRTLRDGKDWLYENRLHFADNFTTASQETYILTFDPVPDVVLSVESIEPMPEEGTIAEADIDELIVKFNKAIDKETFTGDDITFNVQGVKQDASQIVISTEDNKNFTLDLRALNEQCTNGYYTLTVQTADITDTEGFQGKTGKQVGWILFRGGLVQLLTSAYPENSGSVMRKPNEEAGTRSLAPADDANTAKYGSSVTLVAEAETGYEFANWTLNGEVVSTDVEFTTTALGDMNVVANFTKKKYMVEIASSDETKGSVAGTATGIYEHGTKLEVKAEPAEDYALKNWTVGGEVVENSTDKLTLIAEGPLTITAEFLQEYYRQNMTLARGWNWMSAYLSEPLAISSLTNYVNRIVSQTDELINDPEFGLVGNISELEAGKAYKIEANSRFTNTFRGHLYDVGTAPITLHKGWNWVAYPYKEQAALSSAITNAEEGDYITSQTGFSEYAEGSWEGTLDMLTPGEGYLYKSSTDKVLSFDFSQTINGSRAWMARTATVTEQDIDIHRYPNTMNMTVLVVKDGMVTTATDYNIYAIVNDGIRGISQTVGNKHYLTVYGDEPVDITFVVESAETGESFVAVETLKFRDDVVGNRKNPFVLNIGSATGIDAIGVDGRPMTIYTLQGILVSREVTLKQLHRLPKGVYIVNGQKCYIK